MNARSNSLRKFATPLLALALVLATAAVASACPNCKDALAQNDPDRARVVAGYYYSILFMMSMPFMILGGFVGYMYLLVRRARAKTEREESREREESVL